MPIEVIPQFTFNLVKATMPFLDVPVPFPDDLVLAVSDCFDKFEEVRGAPGSPVFEEDAVWPVHPGSPVS